MNEILIRCKKLIVEIYFICKIKKRNSKHTFKVVLQYVLKYVMCFKTYF